MTVIMSKQKADALRSAEKDKSYLTDKAADERVRAPERERPLSKAESRAITEFRMKAGK